MVPLKDNVVLACSQTDHYLHARYSLLHVHSLALLHLLITEMLKHYPRALVF